ncbi:MAG: D-2-hydroxyacid dehydrogenase [Bacteroidales bacterium]
MNIVVLDAFPASANDCAWEELRKLGNTTVYVHTSKEQVLERSADAEVILTNKVIFSKDVISQLTKLKYIGVLATGINNIDLDAATKAGVVVTNVPAYSTDSVAQMTFAHFLCVANKVESYSEDVHKGEWERSKHFCFYSHMQIELCNKTLGIIGFGKIGQKIAQIGQAFGMNIVFNNRSDKRGLMNATEQLDIETLFRVSDFISVNVPLTEDTKEFINLSLLAECKNNVVISNTGRGLLVNEHDMAEALEQELIRAYCADVLSSEPPMENNPLLRTRNCYLTPHIGWATVEARMRLINIATENVEGFIGGQAKCVCNNSMPRASD